MAIKREVFWITGSTLINIATVFLVFSFLAHFGSADSLGELAIINIVLSIVLLLQDSGLSNYFIHRQQLTVNEKSTLYLINVMLGAFATILVFFLSGFIGDFYQSESISRCLRIVAFNFVFLGLISQYQANFIKHLKSEILSKIDVTVKLFTLLLMTLLFQLGFQPLDSYVWAVFLSTALKFFLVVYLSPREWHPQFLADKGIIKPALSFGGFQMGSQILNQIRGRLDQVIIGKWLGTDVLGIYTIAKEFVLQPNKLISPIVSRIVLPRLAKKQEQHNETYKVFNKSNNYILVFNAIVYVLLAIVLYHLIPILYGNEYSAAFDIFIVLIVIGMIRPLGSIFGAFAQSRGKSNVEFKWNVISFTVVIAVMLLATLYQNIMVYALFMSLTQILLTTYAVVFFSKNLFQLDINHHVLRVCAIVVLYIILLFVFLPEGVITKELFSIN